MPVHVRIDSPVAVNFLAVDVGIAGPTSFVASGRRAGIREGIGGRDATIRRQPKDLAQQHVRGLRVQNAIVVLLRDAPTAIADADVQIPVGAESNLSGIVPAVRESGRFEEHLLGGRVDDVVGAQDEPRQAVDGTFLGRTGSGTVVVLVVGVIQIYVAIAAGAEVGVEGRAAEPTLNVGADLVKGQGLGFGRQASGYGVEVLNDPEQAVLFWDQHGGAVGTDLEVDGGVGIVEGEDELLIKVGHEGRIDPWWGLGQSGRWK